MNTQHRQNWQKQIARLFLGSACFAAVLPLSSQAASSDLAKVQDKINYVNNNAHAQGFKLINGKASGGNAPIAYSAIALVAAGASGYGSGNVVGLGFSDNGGKIYAAYVCPADNPQIYAVALGGNAGAGYNTAIGLSAALGACNSLPAQFTIDEATTIAAVYALNQFLDSQAQNLGTSASNLKGLNNAVSTVANLANTATGLAQTTLVTGATGTPPTATVNTLANLLSACVASAGASSIACSGLFASATQTGGSLPSTTLQATVDIARNPGNNVAALYTLASSVSAYQPALTVSPHDWTLGLSFSGGQLANSAPSGLAIDAAGNVWVSNNFSDFGVNGGNGSVVRLSPQGLQAGPYIDNGAVIAPLGIAIDGSGNVFVANNVSAANVNGGSGSVTALSGSGVSLSGSPFAGGKTQNPSLVAIDAGGDVWVSNSRSLSEFTPSSGYTGSNVPVAGSRFPANLTALALDGSGNLYLGDSNNNVLIELSSANPAQPVSGSPFSGGGLYQPSGVALDSAGNVWTANNVVLGVPRGLTEFVKTVGSFTAANFLNGGESSPGNVNPVAIDSAGNVLVANADLSGNTPVFGVVALNNSGAALPGSPFTASNVLKGLPQAAAIDASGNVWVSDGFGGDVVEVVGFAKPVKTPLIGQPKLP